ncbi:helix-turn-helix domain-containing protein, partial [Patescibacteria group bacterium]|nr:helix-turn-helix domain-containing protein [Patescibacteria group bacterium]
MEKKNATYIRVWANKIRAINFLGGRCKNCGDGNVFHLVFHHTKDKDKNFSEIKDRRWSVVLNEIKKCTLLCGNCHRELHFVKDTKRSELKRKLLEIKGEVKCSLCGYKGANLASLDFHHVKDKEFNIGTVCRGNGMPKALSKIIDEIEKCIVVCANCHAEKSVDKDKFIRSEKDILLKVMEIRENKDVKKEVLLLNKKGFLNKEICNELACSPSTVSTILKRCNRLSNSKRNGEKFYIKCMQCGKQFEVQGKYRYNHRQYCSRKCSGMDKKRKLEITKKDLKKILSSGTYSSVARECGVVPNTVRNLAKRYGLIETLKKNKK